MATIEKVEVDVLVMIAEKLGKRDLRNLRLVNKLCHLVVGQSALALQPHKRISNRQLLVLGQKFRSATALNLRGNEFLANSSLSTLPSHFPHLR